MNFAIFIVGVVLFSATNINGLIENTKSFKCKFSSCCHNAQKPSNYSHVKIEYTVNFTSESAYLTILSMNPEANNNMIYRVSNITSGEPGNHTLKTRDNFIYCFYQVKNQSELSNKKKPFFYSFGYEFDEDSFKAEILQIQGQLEEKRKIQEEIKENTKNITKEEEIKNGEKSIEIKEQVETKNITGEEKIEEKIEVAEKDKLDKSIKIEDEQIKIKENTKNITKEEEIKIEEKSIKIKEQVETKNITEEKIEIAEKDKLDKSIKIEDEQIKIKENTKNITKEEEIKIEEKQELEKSIEIKNNDKQENNNNEENKKIKNQDLEIKSSNCTKLQKETFKKEEIKEEKKKNQDVFSLDYLVNIWGKAWAMRKA